MRSYNLKQRTPKYNAELVLSCLNQAVNTYVQLIEETGVSYDVMSEQIDYIRELVNVEGEYSEAYLNSSELSKYTPLHNCEYDLDDGGVPDRGYHGAIIIAVSGEKTLILDGNHRRNTFLKHLPNQKLLVIEIFVKLPSELEAEENAG